MGSHWFELSTMKSHWCSSMVEPKKIIKLVYGSCGVYWDTTLLGVQVTTGLGYFSAFRSFSSQWRLKVVTPCSNRSWSSSQVASGIEKYKTEYPQKLNHKIYLKRNLLILKSFNPQNFLATPCWINIIVLASDCTNKIYTLYGCQFI